MIHIPLILIHYYSRNPINQIRRIIWRSVNQEFRIRKLYSDLLRGPKQPLKLFSSQSINQYKLNFQTLGFQYFTCLTTSGKTKAPKPYLYQVTMTV